MGKLTSESAFVRAGLVLLCLIVLVGVLYFTRRRAVDMDVVETGKAVAGDLEQAAETVRDTSEDAFLTAKVRRRWHCPSPLPRSTWTSTPTTGR